MLTISLTVSAQHVTQTDTLRPYCLPIWQAWRIVRDLQTLDHTAVILDSALVVIQLKNVALESAERTIQAKDSVIKHTDNEAKACRSLVGVNEKIHKVELKAERKKGRYEGSILGGGIGLLLVILLL